MKRTSFRFESLITFAVIVLFMGCSRTGDQTTVLVPEPSEDTLSATQPGLTGGIFGSSDLKRLTATSHIETVNQKWDKVTGYGTGWSAEWEGYLISPVTGILTLKGETNREAIVTLGGEKTIHISGTGQNDSARVRLHRGRKYDINIKYFQRSEGNVSSDEETFLTLSWSYRKRKMTVIPESALVHSSDQEGGWLYPGEIYKEPFDPYDTSGYKLDPLRIAAPELSSLDFSLPTGGLRLAEGITTYTICRADRESPMKAEGLGYTYQHHPDIAVWHGRIYVGWNTCQVDEDTWPSREVYSTSLNGRDWSKPAEMFPQGVSTPLRMYFYLSPQGRMLMIAGLRTSIKSLSERNKYGIVVREINADHSLGKVYTLRKPKEEIKEIPPFYESSVDAGFVGACRDLLNDYIYLSQQDYGNLLEPDQRMRWFDPQQWEGDALLKDLASEFGKAFCFFERKDGTLVGVAKRRWVTLSSDGGKTWSQPVRPKSLVTHNGKVWGQETADGRYALIYNPDLTKRWPLVMLTSNDGITFRNPRSIGSDLPEIRYNGRAKDRGLSYHRGLSHWNNDRSRNDSAFWLVYSINKEDIVISRIPY